MCWNIIGSMAVVANEKNIINAYKVNGKGLVQEVIEIQDKMP